MLTQNERTRLFNAFIQLKSRGEYDRLSKIHRAVSNSFIEIGFSSDFQAIYRCAPRRRDCLALKAEGKIKKFLGGAKYVTMCISFLKMLFYCWRVVKLKLAKQQFSGMFHL